MVALINRILLLISLIFTINTTAMKLTQKKFTQAHDEFEKKKKKEILQQFIQANYNPNNKLVLTRYYSEYPLVYAAQQGYVDEVKQLLENGANPNLGYPLYAAIGDLILFERHFQCASLLLDYGANPDKERYFIKSVFIKIITQSIDFMDDNNGKRKIKYSNKSYREFIIKLLQHSNPYRESMAGKSYIELTQEKLEQSQKVLQKEFFLSLLKKLQVLNSITFIPKSLKELAMRKVVAHDFHIIRKEAFPTDLLEEIQKYLTRKDTVHLTKRYCKPNLSLKELAMRKVITYNLHNKYKDQLPINLQEEIAEYSTRKDMVHLIRKVGRI